MLRTYVAAEGMTYIIDTLEVHDDMYKLRSIFADPKIVKVGSQCSKSAHTVN